MYVHAHTHLFFTLLAVFGPRRHFQPLKSVKDFKVQAPVLKRLSQTWLIIICSNIYRIFNCEQMIVVKKTKKKTHAHAHTHKQKPKNQQKKKDRKEDLKNSHLLKNTPTFVMKNCSNCSSELWCSLWCAVVQEAQGKWCLLCCVFVLVSLTTRAWTLPCICWTWPSLETAHVAAPSPSSEPSLHWSVVSDSGGGRGGGGSGVVVAAISVLVSVSQWWWLWLGREGGGVMMVAQCVIRAIYVLVSVSQWWWLWLGREGG